MKRLLILFVLILAVVIGACGSPSVTDVPAASSTNAPEISATDAPAADEPSLPQITITAEDFGYKAPLKTGSGWVRVVLKNSGSEPHHVQFLWLNDGISFQQFQDALAQGEGPAMALVKQVGGVGAVAPGLSGSAVINLPAGEYVVLCFIPSPTSQQPHFAMGMIKTMTVEDRNNTASEPFANLSVRLKDFAFDLPESLPNGPVTIQVTNDGPEPHEFNIMRLADGKSAGDVLQFLNGEVSGLPPFIPIGGMNGLDVGATGYAELNLLPGRYVAICNIPSPSAEGKPHFMLGMLKEFTVGDPTAFNFPFGTFVKSTDANLQYIFRANGTWSVLDHGQVGASGTYSIDGDVYTETSNDGACEANISFNYVYDGKTLTFNYVGNPEDDKCVNRAWDFNNVTYNQVEN